MVDLSVFPEVRFERVDGIFEAGAAEKDDGGDCGGVGVVGRSGVAGGVTKVGLGRVKP
ncbi:hypothetical protein D3C85_1505780 [compost metagenome]